eukprot:387495-Pleurochrysis_carterae.AAC.2
MGARTNRAAGQPRCDWVRTVDKPVRFCALANSQALSAKGMLTQPSWSEERLSSAPGLAQAVEKPRADQPRAAVATSTHRRGCSKSRRVRTWEAAPGSYWSSAPRRGCAVGLTG